MFDTMQNITPMNIFKNQCQRVQRSRFKFHFYNELYRTKIKIHYRIFFSINYNLVFI